jgi:energy-coupling factor transporter transmembrane protein EcfT
MPGEIPASPTSILKQAIKAVPAVKYALGIGGIVAVIAIVFSFGISPKVAIFGTVIMLILMVVLLLLASLVGKSGTHVSLPALVFTWFSLLLFMATSVLLFTSAFWAKPLDLKTFMSSSKPGLETSSRTPPDQNNPVQQNTSPVDQRAQHEQVTLSPLDQEAHAWELRGDKAAALAIVLEIKLPDLPAEELAKANTGIIEIFKQARSAWTNALNTAVTKQYKAALRTKLKSGSGGGLTCEVPDDDHLFCYPNGSEFDVVYSGSEEVPVIAKHVYNKP